MRQQVLSESLAVHNDFFHGMPAYRFEKLSIAGLQYCSVDKKKQKVASCQRVVTELPQLNPWVFLNTVERIVGKLSDNTSGLGRQRASKDLQPASLSQADDTALHSKPYGEEPAAPEEVEVNSETPVRHLKGCSLKKAAQPAAQLKCLYTSACSMGNKQEELEAIVLLERYDIVAITETWWDESYNWSVGIEGYKLFRRDRGGRRGGGVDLYVKEWIECEEMSPKPSLGSDEV
ncbi:nipped-b-like protein [Limosa lapponica baueri]|uniref:Nipped-b-like protein n=1 Tax=Limosa lapponica baueri TaxID=1758121 RepID=A0A2I0U1Z6_LIMLA|nr:nipped-b-like protein [Limosa lapponica baueri]